MPLHFDKGGVMEYLWGQLTKTPDGNHIVYHTEEIDGLWWMGFVDTQAYSLDRWRAVFEPFRQADGSFLIGHDAFLALEKYRYTGEIKVPFDATLINEGAYTDEGLAELIDLSVRPSCLMAPADFTAFVDGFKKRHRETGGLIRIDRRAKEEIGRLIDEHPSPLRNLERILDRMLEEGVDEEMAQQLSADDTTRATTEAARQVSTFSAMPGSRAEAEARRLKALQGSLGRTPAARAPAEEPASTELKRIRRSRKGMRG